MNLFDHTPTSDKIVDACEAECNKAWAEYLTINQLDPKEIEPIKPFFRCGFLAGARWISEITAQKFAAAQKQHL